MARGIKLVLRTGLIVLLFLPLLAVGHYFAFPEETRCVLIDFSDFKRENDLYFRSGVAARTLNNIRTIINEAEKRDSEFLGSLVSKPRFIYCDNEADYAKYGNISGAPACTHTKLGAYVILSKEGLNTDVIAHEILHAELYQRLGFFRYQFTIPVWFNEGLAMQTDYRSDFSADSLKGYSDNFSNLPDLNSLRTAKQFYSGDAHNITLNFSYARYKVNLWYSKERFARLISEINKGASFERAYQ